MRIGRPPPPSPGVTTITAPRPAPAVMPSRPGSANGLRTVPCTTIRRVRAPRRRALRRPCAGRARRRRGPRGRVLPGTRARGRPCAARGSPRAVADHDGHGEQHDRDPATTREAAPRPERRPRGAAAAQPPARACRRASTTITMPPSSAVGMPVGMEAAPSAPRIARKAASASRISSAPRSPAGRAPRRDVAAERGDPAGEQPGEHRGAESDEGDRSGERHRGAGEQHGAEDRGHPRVERPGHRAKTRRLRRAPARPGDRERQACDHGTATISGNARMDASRFNCASEPLPQANRPVVFSLKRIRSIAVGVERHRDRGSGEDERVAAVPAARPARPARGAASRPPTKATPLDAQSGTERPKAATA